MRKKISAALLSMLLVFQVMSSGYLAPMAAFANEPVSTNETTDTQTPEQTAEQQAEAEAAQKKALEEAQQAVDDLFTDTTHKTIKEGLVDAQINTAGAYVDKLQDGADKTKLQTLLAEARNQVAQAETAKKETLNEEAVTEETPKEEVATEETPKEEVATEETVVEETPADESESGGTDVKEEATAGTEITENIISNIQLTVNGDLKKPGDTIEPTASEIKEGFETALTLDYTLPNGHGYKGGSTFTFNLPKNMEMDSLINETPLIGDPLFGTFNVTKEGKVTITFNENIESHDNVKGQLGFTSLIKADLTQESEQDLVIQPVSGSTSYTFKLKYPKPNLDSKTPLTKAGKFIGNYNQKEANWNVEANNQAKELENAVVEDVLPDGMEYVEGSLTVKEYKVLVDGNLSEVGSVSVTPTYDQTSRKLTIPLGKTSHVFKLSYKTQVVGAYKEEYTNAATLKDDSTPIGSTVTETIKPNIGKIITKNGKGMTDDEANVKWEIQFNGKDEVYPSGTYLSDTAFISKEANNIKISEATIDEEGKWGGTQTEITDFTVESGKLTFNTDITKPIIIEYQSKIPDGTASGATLSNTVNVNGKTTTEFKATATNTVTGTGINKTYGTPDYKNQLIEWTITANTGAVTLKTGATITDEMPKGLTLQAGTVEVTGIDADDYTLTTENNTIVLTTKKDVKSVITITYQTKFALDDTGAGSATKYGYTNTATFNYKNKYGVTTPLVKGEAKFTPKSEVQANGYKKGVFDATTKTVEWTVDVNYNERTISNAIVKDTLKQDDGFSIDQNKFKVVEDGTNKELVKDIDYTVEFGPYSKSYELTFKNSINKEYQIVYTTTDDDKIYTGSYTNTAELYNGTELLTTLTKTVDGKDSNDTNTNFNNYIEKTGVQNTTNPDLLDWTIIVNKAGSKLKNFTITDTPKGLQTLKTDSVKIVSEKDGTVLEENTDYTLQYFKETGVFEIKFSKEINEAYKITYTTSFVAEKNIGDISNEVKVTADGLTNADTNKTGITTYRTSTAWGTSEGNLYKLNLHKKTNDATEKALAGIKFNLYSDKDKKTLVDTETTNGAGDLTFYRLLKSKDYYLEEVNTPSGYVNPGLTKINFSTITNGEVNDDFINKAEVKAVKLTKTTNNGEKLAGVIFELKDSNGDNVEIDGKTEFTTDANGEIYLGNTDFDDASKKLANGSYTFVEKKTVQGYKLDKTPKKFEITDGKTGAIEVSMKNNACTEAEVVIKLNNKTIQDAKVEVYKGDESQNVTAKTNSNGIAKIDLKYATSEYKVKVTYGDRIIGDINLKSIDENCQIQLVLDTACANDVIIVKYGNQFVKNAAVVITNDSESKEVKTDEKGRAVFKPGDIKSSTKVTIDDGKRLQEFTNLNLNDKCQVTVTMLDTACKQIAVTVQDGTTLIKNAKVQILNSKNEAQDLDGNGKTSLATDDNGQVIIPTKYATGDYQIKVSKTGYAAKTIQFNPINCEFILNMSENVCSNVVVKVVDNQKAIQDATVTIYKDNKIVIEDDKEVKGTTDSQGIVTFKAKYGSADYQVRIQYGDRVETTKEMSIDDDCSVEIVLDTACVNDVIIVKYGNQFVKNAAVVITNGSESKEVKTDEKGRAVFNPGDLTPSTKVTIDDGKRLQEFTGLNLNDKCQVTVTMLDTACKEIAVTVQDGTTLIKNAKVQILNSANEAQDLDGDGKTSLTTDENGQVVIPTKYATGDYKIKVSKTGYKTATTPFDPTNCEFTVDFGVPTLACEDIEITFTGDQVNENKVYVVNQDGEKQKITTDDKTETNLDAAGKVVIPSKYATGDYKIVFVQDGKQSIVTPIDSDDCKQTIELPTNPDAGTPGGACENTTITVKDGTKLIENARVVITDQDGAELFNGVTNAQGEITTDNYIALKNVTVKVYAKGYNTATTFTLSDEDCKAEVNLTPNACADYAINVVDEKGDKIAADGFLKDSAFTIKNQNNVEVATDVKINADGQLVDSKGKIINKDELKNYTTDTYTLVQTKTAPGYQTMQDAVVQDLDNCSGLVTINFNKTTEPTNPGVSCPDFKVTYKGPANSTAEFKIVKVTTDADGKVTKEDLETGITVVTDADTKVSTLNTTTKSFEPGKYELVQTKDTSGYYMSAAIPFEVKMGECVAELTVTNASIPPSPPAACTDDVLITIKDTEGQIVSTNNAKVTVDGKDTAVSISNSQVTIPKTALDSSKEQTVIITLEDGRTTTVVLPADRVECTANAVVPVLKVCEQDKTITIKDVDGKDLPTDKIVKVTVGDKEVTPKVENGKLVISKDLINPKEDTTITVTTKGGEQGFVTIPKYSETCDYTIVIQNACDAFTVNVTENGKKATTGTVSIVDADGKTVATEKVSANGTATFPAKYADAQYTVSVTIGKTTVTAPVNVDVNCGVTVDVKTLACEKAAVLVTVDGKAKKDATVIVVDANGKTVQTVKTDATGTAKVDPKYATKDYQVKVTVGKETKTVTMVSCNVTINFKTPVVDGETEEPAEPGKPSKPTTPTTKPEPSKPGTVVGGDTEENTNTSKPKPTVKPGDRYDVYDEDGNLIASDVTVDQDGNISTELPPGKYQFVTKGDQVTAVVGKDGKLPQTGSSDFLWYTLAGIALLGTSLVVFARGRRKNA